MKTLVFSLLVVSIALPQTTKKANPPNANTHKASTSITSASFTGNDIEQL